MTQATNRFKALIIAFFVTGVATYGLSMANFNDLGSMNNFLLLVSLLCFLVLGALAWRKGKALRDFRTMPIYPLFVVGMAWVRLSSADKSLAEYPVTLLGGTILLAVLGIAAGVEAMRLHRQG